MADLSVAGRIYRNGKLSRGTLHIDTETGRIEKVAKTAKLAEHLDFGDKAILPGALDIHVHFRDPGQPHKEDLHTGSVAAAFGGVTGFVDMPNTAPPTTTLKALKDKLASAAKKSVVDYAAWSGATWYLDDLPEMMRWSPGVKIYLGASTGDLLMDDDGRVQQALRIAGEAGRVVVVHAEAERVLQRLRRTEETPRDHDLTRPPVAEVDAIFDLMKALHGVPDAPRVHVAHAASADALQAARRAGFTTGVCPHHLLLDTEDRCPEPPGYAKMNPPLRDGAHRKALWDTFAAGDATLVESDHAPHTVAEKTGRFHEAPAGVPGVETMVPLLLGRVAAGDLPLALAVDAVTQAPADLLGLNDRGRLEPGAIADFAVYDLDAPLPIAAGDLHSKCGWTPFEGHDAVRPSDVWVRGHPVVQDGGLVAKAGDGAPLMPLPEGT